MCLLMIPFFISDFIKNIVVLQFLTFNSTTQRMSEQINKHLLCVSGLCKEEELDCNISASVSTAVSSCTLTNPRKSVEKHRQYKQPKMFWIRSSEGTVYRSNQFAGCAKKEMGKYVLLRKLRYAHCLLYEISRSINVAFSTQNLVLMVSSFISMVVLMYEIVIVSFDMILTRSVNSKCGNLVMCIAWVVQNTWRVCSLVYSSEAVVQEASRTENLVNKLMLSPFSSDCMCCSELQLFAQQLTYIRIRYSAASLLSLDYRMVKAVVGTVTTYMVILIQFRLSNMREQ
ncbi:putative gustatory receptor 28b [Schistocerca gregaria]|uniref:putative gustatory receptor 28b n=1 Tax=Schistocerca gregaria TaxID=7010 RepID=UPI00211E13D1|nr:putative gustatory receptor 28b [Schistocerca gregaria]